jgi:hypothetical protein
MNHPLPAIIVSYTTGIAPDTFTEFERSVAAEGLDLQLEQRDEDGPYAGLEWLVPTAVVLFVGKAYFDGFLKEMGKDHYALLKAGVKSLYAKLVGPQATQVVIVSTRGKASSEQPFSLLYSILAEADGGARFKLLLQRGATRDEYEATVEAFFQFVDAYHSGTLSSEAKAELQNAKVVSKTILMTYDAAAQRLQVVDPLPPRRDSGV